MNRVKLFSLLAGLLAALFYVAHVVIGGLLWPGYSHLAQAISDLTGSGAPNRGLMLGLTTTYGWLSVVFALGLLVNQPAGRPRAMTVGLALFLAMHLVSLSYGLFPVDLPGSALSFAGLMHGVVTGLIVPLTIAAPILVGIGARRLPGWRTMAIYSIITGCLIFVLGGSTVAAMATKAPWFGLLERLNIGSLIVWMGVLSVFSYRKESAS